MKYNIATFLITMVLMVFILLGVFFSGIIVEEIVHIFTIKGAKSICIDYNLKATANKNLTYYMVAHTTFDGTEIEKLTLEEYYDWRSEKEKIAGIIKNMFTIPVSFCLGIIFFEYITNRVSKWKK